LPRYLPRKGTETLVKITNDLNNVRRICHDIYPARGRKHNLSETWEEEDGYLPRYLPRKGTETISKIRAIRAARFYRNLPRYLPRKGTETTKPFLVIILITNLGICHDIYPARGRKQLSKIRKHSILTICHDIYPARGRKPQSKPIFQSPISVICHDIYPARGRKLQTTY